ncbi:MAG: hypothetical protein ABI613_09635, partial [Gemmatimonadota bacterium]
LGMTTGAGQPRLRRGGIESLAAFSPAPRLARRLSSAQEQRGNRLKMAGSWVATLLPRMGTRSLGRDTPSG